MSDRTILGLLRLPARLEVDQAAAVLGFRPYEIPILIRGNLLRPLGRPTATSTSAPLKSNSSDGTLWVGTASRLDLFRDGVFYRHWFASGKSVERLTLLQFVLASEDEVRVTRATEPLSMVFFGSQAEGSSVSKN